MHIPATEELRLRLVGDSHAEHLHDEGVLEVGQAHAGVGQEVVAAEDGDLVAVLQLEEVVLGLGIRVLDQLRNKNI